MGFKCGIVGLPNVGKSTLFNALTETAAAQAANYPFCTIEPNVGEVAVPDPRLDKLSAIAKSAQIIPTRLTFVDIAGLVRGASKGEGLGNQFLATIREVDAVAHVVRCFEDSDITHVEGKIAPLSDIEIIETELMLADLESLERRVTAAEKKAKTGDKDSALRMLSDLDQLSQHREVVGYWRALLYLSLNNKDEALRWLEQGFEERDGSNISWIKVDPLLNSLHGDPRFEALVQKVVAPK